MAATFPLIRERERDYAIRLIQRTPLDGKMEVVIRRATRNKGQNAMLHAALTDIAEQLAWPLPPRKGGELHDLEWWKRRLTLGCIRDPDTSMHAKYLGTEVIESLDDPTAFAVLLPRTSDLDKDDASELCEWVISFGALNGVVFKEPEHKDAAPIDPEAYEAFR